MLAFYPITSNREILRDNPLYVGNFFKLRGMHWPKRGQRQALILSIANAWLKMVKRSPGCPGMLEEETFITSLTAKVYDARKILDHFFTVRRLGFNFGDGAKSPTIISPKQLSKRWIEATEELNGDFRFNPGPAPTDIELTNSEVVLRRCDLTQLKDDMRAEECEQLIPIIEWLYEQNGPITFYFKPSGKLQARDTSVWPIRAFETWPSWLRKRLFGVVVDIENSFTQFLVGLLEQAEPSETTRKLIYNDLFRLNYDKTAFREEICRDVLKLPVNPQNLKLVKTVIMALANGSNISPIMLCSDSSRSQVVSLLNQNMTMSTEDRFRIGNRLRKIAKQFRMAKRRVCRSIYRCKPTRANTKRIFREYFTWERKARYKIHKACGYTGVHLHDGIDGVVTNLSPEELSEHIYKTTQVRVSVEA